MLFQFRDAFTKAFNEAPQNFVWGLTLARSHCELKTTAMQSYIYPAIAASTGLYLICEFNSDAGFFDQDTMQTILGEQRKFNNDRNSPMPVSRSGGNPRIELEHEIRPLTSRHEMKSLASKAAPLNVLITYQNDTVSKQLLWANEIFSDILSGVGNSRAFLLILPGKEPDVDPQVRESLGSRKTKHAGWWNFFEWVGTEFRRLGTTETQPSA